MDQRGAFAQHLKQRIDDVGAVTTDVPFGDFRHGGIIAAPYVAVFVYRSRMKGWR